VHHPLPIPLEGLNARGFGRRGVSDGAIVNRHSGGFYHGLSLVILRMKEEKMDYRPSGWGGASKTKKGYFFTVM
jgi:hypothetical protein